MKNKGFSLVELIIVIAIMAILAGALVPTLIKYINNARLSNDINTGREIANAIMEAVTSEDAYESAEEHTTPVKVNEMDGPDFKAEVFEIISMTNVKGTAKKDVDGSLFPSQDFYYTLDSKRNKVEVFYGDKTSAYMVYPIAGNKIAK